MTMFGGIKMVSFESDYIAGAHPQVLKKICETNLEPLSGYGSDPYCASAKEKIRNEFECPDGDVYFLVGGTQTNQVVIDTVLNKWEGVISATTGHINVHEAGAIEFTGHKVFGLEATDGKLDSETVRQFCQTFYNDGNREHMVTPGMVYISLPTELGTLYSKQQLSDIYDVCKQYNMTLFIDGARLGYGLASKQNDLSYSDVAKLCDVFYIGGTKVGALCGEAVVFTHHNAPKAFTTQIKQHGALLAKGRLLGVQFDTLFTDHLYRQISEYAIEKAEQLKEILNQKGCQFYLQSPTNQQFVIIENDKMKKLAEKVKFSFWDNYDENHTVIRFVTSWSTTDEDIKVLAESL